MHLVRALISIIATSAWLYRIIEYKFKYNYNVVVTDTFSNSYHGVKPAIGTASAVNTPYGLYLDGETVYLPPNSSSGSGNSNVFNIYNTATLNLFIRYLPGKTGSFERELFTLKNTDLGITRLQLRQKAASESDSPVFELESNTGTSATQTSGQYEICKVYLDKWFLFTISYKKNSYPTSTDLLFCINGDHVATQTFVGETFPRDFNSNYLNGANTRAIYYSFNFYYGDISECGTSFNYVSLFDNTGSCAYVCPSGSSVCEVNSYNYDTNCESCDGLCGNFGCVKKGLECYTATCPPSYLTNSNCNSCYANSYVKNGVCACKYGYEETSANPLTCVSASIGKF